MWGDSVAGLWEQRRVHASPARAGDVRGPAWGDWPRGVMSITAISRKTPAARRTRAPQNANGPVRDRAAEGLRGGEFTGVPRAS